MRSSFKVARVLGIDIEIHATFFILLMFFFMLLGPKGMLLILGVFFFVTIHELCHSLAALYFGISVKKITLLPIGGVASMSEIPRKPFQELVISLAGPMSNIMVLVIFYWPLNIFLGHERLMHPLLVIAGRGGSVADINILAYIYWLNLMLAMFNILPAFPMDGGRVLRALLSYRMSYKRSTDIAVKLGHVFALLFAYIGLLHGHIFLLIIAVFIYMSASSEGLQVNVSETIKDYTVKNVLSREYISVSPETPLARVLELVFHSHQEDFPVTFEGSYAGLVTRKELMRGIHERGKTAAASEIMRTDLPGVDIDARLHEVRKLMTENDTRALAVMKDGRLAGIVTLDDINKVFLMIGEKYQK